MGWAPSVGAQEALVGMRWMLSLDEPSSAVLQAAWADMFVRYWGGQRRSQGDLVTAF